jgi:hypothetical protein
MDLGITKTEYGTDSKEWVGSENHTTTTITLWNDAFLARWADGVPPSGVAISRVTSAIGGAPVGSYVPYDNAFDADPATAGQQSDGRDVLAGHLFSVYGVLKAGRRSGAALYDSGPVRESKLPTNHGLDAAGKADVAGRIWYR